MSAFAANSILCRLALKTTQLDPASFTLVRILSGALLLALLVSMRGQPPTTHGSWRGALALFIYVAAFSFAYLTLSAGTGALLLFGAVQITMIFSGLIMGEHLAKMQGVGLIAALAGLVLLVSPNITTPALAGALLMTLSGIAWGVYSLIGRGATDPAATTASNFIRAVPLAGLLALGATPWLTLDMTGVFYAIISGALTSGLGYVLWYRVLQDMSAITASTIQLSVPVLAALGGVIWLDETLTLNMLIATALTLGGIGLVLRAGRMKAGGG